MAYQTKHELTADQRAVLTEQMIGELHERLVGNGQPGSGEIEKMHTRIKPTNDRSTVVERWQDRANGAFVLVARIMVACGVIAGIVSTIVLVLKATKGSGPIPH